MWLALKRKFYELYPKLDTIGDSQEEWEAFKASLVEA